MASVSTAAAAAAAKSLQSCSTLCDPLDGCPSGSPSLGFSRQEYWSGLPFASPVHKSEKWKWSCSVVSHSSRPHELQPTRLLCPWDFPGKSTGVGCHCLLYQSLLVELKVCRFCPVWVNTCGVRIVISEIPCIHYVQWALLRCTVLIIDKEEETFEKSLT